MDSIKKKKKKLVLKPREVPEQNEPLEEKKTKIIKKTKKPKKTKKDNKQPMDDIDDDAVFKIHKELNKNLREVEEKEAKYFEENPDAQKGLYPTLNDPNFIIKIAEKREFNETKYKGDIGNVEIMAEQKCNENRELAPHQIFVKNFMSFNTPYNSLLLYHGLGSGKTCAAVGIMEETRDYFKQLSIEKPIYVLAQPNVQGNFKTEIFDPRKLIHTNNVWSINSCIGNKLLKEINTNTIKLSKEAIVKQIEKLIRKSYSFFGYGEFSSHVINSSRIEGDYKKGTKKKLINDKLNSMFSNTLIVIDEVHNIRNSSDYKVKKSYNTLLTLARNVDNLRFLFLSATPMFNDSREIIPIINLMNTNDNRSNIGIKEVFDTNGNLKVDENGDNIGEILLKAKCNGYISYVRGENPYTYPYKIYPRNFNPDKSILNMTYPSKTLNGGSIIQPIQYVDIFMINISPYQQQVYDFVLNSIKTEEITFDTLESFGYNLLTPQIQALNMCYPNNYFIKNSKTKKELLYGVEGLKSIMKYDSSKKNFEYKTLEFNRIFSPDEIGKYSQKIASIAESIITSTGIVLIYSNYLDSGIIPMALALEERGFQRFGNNGSLFKPGEISVKSDFKYIIISGDKKISPNNDVELYACTNASNKNGDEIKVVLISRAGTEGLDFKNIRQVHIIEPWYNMNRIEQTIGRAVRTKSHCGLPFIERNVMIFLYGSILEDNSESTDLYIYRRAEEKAVQIGKVNRLLKQNAVDCLLNTEQGNFTEELLDQSYDITLSNRKVISYRIGDKPFSDICDYMESCNFVCAKQKELLEENINSMTYNENFSSLNNDLIIKNIKMLFKEYYFLKKEDLISNLNMKRSVSLTQIYSSINQMLYDKNEFLFDRFNRPGHLVNIGEYYFFQPNELENENISVFERGEGSQKQREKLVFNLEKKKEQIQEPGSPTNIPIQTQKENVKINTELNDYLEDMKKNYQITQDFSGKLTSKSSWYESITIVKPLLKSIDATEDKINRYILHHLCDSIPYNIKLKLLDYLYNTSKLPPFEKNIKDYLDTLLIHGKNPAILLMNNEAGKKNKQVMLIFKNKKWGTALPEEARDYSSALISMNEKINTERNELAPIFGYVAPFKNTNEMVYKIKNNSPGARDKGRRCDQAKKPEMIVYINNIFSIIGVDNKINYSKINVVQLCGFQELLLRHLNDTNKISKIWFLPPEKAIFLQNI